MMTLVYCAEIQGPKEKPIVIHLRKRKMWKRRIKLETSQFCEFKESCIHPEKFDHTLEPCWIWEIIPFEDKTTDPTDSNFNAFKCDYTTDKEINSVKMRAEKIFRRSYEEADMEELCPDIKWIIIPDWEDDIRLPLNYPSYYYRTTVNLPE